MSVVVPAYQAERTLGRALASALAQTAPPLEVVVVVDGSTDGTAAVAERHPAPVRCVGQDHAGASAARNRGIREARGRWVAFLDADDEWLPGHLAQGLEVLKADPDLRWCTAAYLRERAGRPLQTHAAGASAVDGACAASYFALASEFTPIVDSMIVRRDVLEARGGFDTGLVTGEDLDLWFRIALAHPRIGYGREPSSVYRDTPGSLLSRRPPPSGAWLDLLRANAERARSAGPELASLAQPLLRSWAAHVVRRAATEGDRAVLRGVARDFGPALPPFWRVLGVACRATPDPLWRRLIALWSWARRHPRAAGT